MNQPKPDPGKINCVDCCVVNLDGCFECRRCTHCGCICRKCVSCNSKHHPKYFCRICKYCKRFNSAHPELQCHCRKAPNFISQVPTGGGFFINNLHRHLGLEIECSYIGSGNGRVSLPPYVQYEWVHDGSITSGGMEMVVMPLAGDNFIRGIWSIAEELDKYGYKADATCGLHVHVEAKDFDAWAMRRLILLYHHFEELFYALVKPGRDEARIVRGETKYYAKRWDPPQQFYDSLRSRRESHDIRMAIMKWLYGSRSTQHMLSRGLNLGRKPELYNAWCDVPEIRRHKYEKARYFGLNLHTWFQRQTVEFRHHEGTVDGMKLQWWPLFCGWFVEIASSLRDDEVEKIRTVHDLIEGKWQRLYKNVEIPSAVGEWVMTTLKERGKI